MTVSEQGPASLMNTEQEMRPCKACGQSEGFLAANDGWFHGECWNCYYRTGAHRSEAEAREDWDRRSSDEQAEVVAWQWSDRHGMWYTVDTNTDRMPFSQQEELARMVAANNGGTVRPLYASPPAVAAGGVTEARVEAAHRVFENASRHNPEVSIRERIRAALTAALAVGDEGIREGEPFAFCCSSFDIDACDCVNKDHGTARRG